MGIKKLAELIKDAVPESVCSVPLQQYRDRIIALDTSICIYQFRTKMPAIINSYGEDISHLQGLFYRTVYLLENGIKPVYVFEGHPPNLKQPLLARRAAASGKGRRNTNAEFGSSQKQDCETLLSHLGVPCVKAPGEAEATCAALVACGKVWATATEDMDALPFGSTRLIRHLKAVRNCEVEEYSLPIVLEKLKLTHEQFVDLCILLGCDYCEKIRGLGPKKALKLLQKHGSIEQILQNIDLQKYPRPNTWPLQESRALFLHPQVADASQILLEWAEPNEEQLVKFLSHEKHMKEERVRKRLRNLRMAQLNEEKPERPQDVPKKKRQKKMQEFFPIKRSADQMKASKPQKSNKKQKMPKMTVKSAYAMTQ
ncbi:probable flap endonuclease 1 homolog [Microcaecilia unicolor]|uniref:Probable flap endonuclease 1 homolog n=1 Tax=Microcaecilia unicolor TaxID=1415580 RepID=A0A6P7ZE56_9AMPH|nr:probable flap endonuclease 1 homolog [Microcaecilia unicolor]